MKTLVLFTLSLFATGCDVSVVTIQACGVTCGNRGVKTVTYDRCECNGPAAAEPSADGGR